MKKSKDDGCDMKYCKGTVDVFYLGKRICKKCWAKWSDKTPDELKRELGIRKK